MIDLNMQFHAFVLDDKGFKVVETFRNRAASKLWAKAHGPAYVFDNENADPRESSYVYMNPGLKTLLKIWEDEVATPLLRQAEHLEGRLKIERLKRRRFHSWPGVAPLLKTFLAHEKETEKND